MTAIKSFIGLDVHKDSLVIAMADEGERDVRYFGKIDGSLVALKKSFIKLNRVDENPALFMRRVHVGSISIGFLRTKVCLVLLLALRTFPSVRGTESKPIGVTPSCWPSCIVEGS